MHCGTKFDGALILVAVKRYKNKKLFFDSDTMMSFNLAFDDNGGQHQNKHTLQTLSPSTWWFNTHNKASNLQSHEYTSLHHAPSFFPVFRHHLSNLGDSVRIAVKNLHIQGTHSNQRLNTPQNTINTLD